MKNLKTKIIINKIIKYIIVLVLIILVLYNMSYILGKQYDEKYNVKMFGYQFGVATGEGMQPEIDHNDMVIYKKVDCKHIHENDIITMYKNDELVVRRIMLKKVNGKFVTKADKYLYNDPIELANEEVEGKVYKVIPNLRIYSKNITI